MKVATVQRAAENYLWRPGAHAALRRWGCVLTATEYQGAKQQRRTVVSAKEARCLLVVDQSSLGSRVPRGPDMDKGGRNEKKH